MSSVGATSGTVNVQKAKESTASRLARLEEAVVQHQGAFEGISETVEDVSNRVKVLENGVNDLVKQETQGALNVLASSIEERLDKRMDERLMALVQPLLKRIDELEEQIVVCRAAVAGSSTPREASTRIKVPQPPKFNGSRDAKEIDNFLWCVERYFDALQVRDDVTKITTASMYLAEDAILWWRRRQGELKQGLCQIRTWDDFKVDFKKQFYPENAEEVALKKLRALRHTGTVKEYVKQFSSIVLDVSSMPENLLLIYFMDGLQRWAEQELKRRNVKSLNEAIAAAESLYELTRDPRRSKEADNSNEIGGGDRQSSTIRGDGTRAKEAVRDQSRTQGRDKGKTFNCFLCGGPHMVRECPQRAKLSAMVMRYEDEESLEAHEPRRLGAMRLLNAGVVDKPTGLATATKLDVEPTLKATRSVEATLKATGVVSKEPAGLDATTNREVRPTKKATEVACKVLATNKEAGRKYKGNLLTVNGKVNGVHTRVLVDSGATHNYVALRVARDMDIRYTRTEVGELKAVNSSATPIYGVAHGVPLRLGKWKGKAKFMVVDIDDEDVVLGMEFIDAVRPFVLGDGVITFVSNGNEFEVELVQQKEVKSRIASLRVTRMPRRRRQRRGGGRSKPPTKSMHKTRFPRACEIQTCNKSGHHARETRARGRANIVEFPHGVSKGQQQKYVVRTYYNDMNGPRMRIRGEDRDEGVHGLDVSSSVWNIPDVSGVVMSRIFQKVVKKTFVEAEEKMKTPNQVAGEILSFFTRNNFVVSDRGETITFEGIMIPSRGQAALLTFCTCISLASVALVLTITFPDVGNNWFWITALSPLAGAYYWKRASRKEQIKVKMTVGEEGKLSEIVVQGDDVQVEQFRKELQLNEKGMVYVKGLFER
ncbi:hypothetical protein KSS87_018092 [Heliosperma pusillum]|nr:hypothetical protein KSS87_018092 [Heliosperma pusillum]